MIVGVSQWEWWFSEMTALFLVAAIAIAVLQRCSEEAFVQHFIAGARDLLGVAFIIGIGRRVRAQRSKCLSVWYGCNGAHYPHRTYLAVFSDGQCKLPTVVALLYAVSAYLYSSANVLAFNN